MLNNLHFLRPQWFYAFIPLAVFLIILMKNQAYSESWRKICDASLLPFILTAKQGKRSILPALLTFLGASLCITALAGPVFKKLQQPVFREQAALVILLDLSQSMNATDIKPSRIERAKLELLDILRQRKGGQTALIVYAANAFTVTPLTDDNNTIANLLPVLQTSMMPAQGSNLGQALDKAHSLFTQAGITQGDILIVTDGIHSRFRRAIKKISAQGYRVSIFGIGTAQGSPVPLDNGFLLDSSGAIVIPKLKINKLRKIAHEGGGIYVGVTADDSDTNALTHLFSSRVNNAIRNNQIIMTDLHADRWREDGVWLLLPLLLIAALWARKGWLISLFIIFLLPLPQPGYAAESAVNPAQKTTASTTSSSPFSLHNLSLDNLWLTPNQKAIRAFKQGKNNAAAKNFTNPEWKASALYRSGKYEQAAKFFDQASNRDKKQTNSSSNDLYNKGNALAKAGKYPQAIAAYNKALTLNKHNKDAAYNRKLVEKALQKQQQKKSGKQSNNNSSNKKSSKQGNKNQQGSKKNNNGKGSKQNAQQKNSAGKQGKQGQQQKQNPSQKSANSASQNNKQNNTARNQSRQGGNNNTQKQQDEAMKKRHPGDAQSKKEKQEQKALKQAEKNQKNSSQGEQSQSNQSQSNQSQSGNRKTQDQKQASRSAENNMTEDQKATEQWLRRIPDDPGGLLRRKFLYQYQQLPNQHDSKQPW